MTESALQDRIRLVLGADPAGVWWRNNIGVAELRGHKVRFGVGGPGGADLIGLFRGAFVAVEVKTPTGRQSEDQRIYQRLVESKQGIYVIVRSEDDARDLLSMLHERFPC
jgi:hypothetical protein